MIIDGHVHVKLGDDEWERTLAAAEKAGVDKICVNCCGEAFGQPGNESVKAALEKYPEKVLGFGYVRLGDDRPEIVDELHAEGFVGLKVIHPKLPYDADEFMPIYERAEKFDMPILFHTGIVAPFPLDGKYDVSSARMRPIHLDRIARRFPEAKLIGAHLGVPWVDEACMVLAFHKNVYYDCTGIIRRLVNKPDSYFDSLIYWPSFPEKWIFGTDVFPPEEMSHLKKLHHQLMERLGLDEEQKAQVLGGRLAGLLGI